jgi:sugar O-acyltransferase (sialic acid O-acetyltransferase NeuD family)
LKNSKATTKVVLLGSGGHSRVLLETLLLSGANVVGFVAPKAAEIEPDALRIRVFSEEHVISWLGEDDCLHAGGCWNDEAVTLVNGVGSVGVALLRKKIFEKFKKMGFKFQTVIHPGAIVSNNAVIGEGAQIMAGCVVQIGAHIGANVILNTGSMIDHDCIIEAHCHIAPRSVLSGSVHVEESTHLGTGAVVIQGRKIGRESVVGAGSVVVTDIPSHVMALGVPAKVHKYLS